MNAPYREPIHIPSLRPSLWERMRRPVVAVYSVLVLSAGTGSLVFVCAEAVDENRELRQTAWSRAEEIKNLHWRVDKLKSALYASGGDWYVAEWGDDSETCRDPVHPCRTLQGLPERIGTNTSVHVLSPSVPGVGTINGGGVSSVTGTNVLTCTPTTGVVSCKPTSPSLPIGAVTTKDARAGQMLCTTGSGAVVWQWPTDAGTCPALTDR